VNSFNIKKLIKIDTIIEIRARKMINKYNR